MKLSSQNKNNGLSREQIEPEGPQMVITVENPLTNYFIINRSYIQIMV